MSIPDGGGVRAVVITWNPDLKRLNEAVAALRLQVRGITIVDNGSLNGDEVTASFAADEAVDVMRLPDNFGIGAALNVGVDVALRESPTWVLTMDQDTLVGAGAVDGILAELSTLDERSVEKCAIVALRPHPQPASIWLTRYADSLLVIRDLDGFVERRGVITSGNLVRADVAQQIRYNEALFIDQVDFDFCFSLRHRGYSVLQQKVVTMDHVLGERYDDVEKVHPYENAQRLYYIVRNSTFMVLRRRLLVRFYLAQVVVFCGAFVSINGATSIPLCAMVVIRALSDAIVGRLGRREYPLLSKGRR